MSRKYYIDIKNASYEWRIKRFALWCGHRGVPTLIHKTNTDKLKDLHDYIKSHPEQVEAWMEELRQENLFSIDWGKDMNAPENIQGRRNFKEKYKLPDL